MTASDSRPKPASKRGRAQRRRRPRASAPGIAPGTLSPQEDAHPTTISYTVYDATTIRQQMTDAVETIPLPADHQTVWIDVMGTRDTRILEALGQRFGIHPLALEDVVNVGQRPKLEAYRESLFLILRMYPPTAVAQPTSEQLSVMLGKGLVITFQERPDDCFARVRERLNDPSRRLRSRQSDYLAYALIDAVVDGYQPVIDGIADRLEEVEDRLLESNTDGDLRTLHEIRRALISLRRTMLPARDVVAGLMRESDAAGVIAEETQVFLRDCHDHVLRTIEQIDSARELCASLMDLYLSITSNRTNDVMKVLTMIATIFIPLSFLVGLYGMNFDTNSPWNMPELSWRYGYPTLVTIMAIVAGLLLVFFQRKGWFK